MKNSNFIKRLASLILSICLIAAIGLSLTSCGEKETPQDNYVPGQSTISSKTSSEAYVPGDTYGVAATDVNKGNGNISFIFRVIGPNDSNTIYRIFTNEKTVGDALQKLNIISGEESTYGLYVKTVNGITADYDKDKAYWAFYVDGKYASTGVDKTDIVKDAEYWMQYTKG
jgi:hypothetical protein